MKIRAIRGAAAVAAALFVSAAAASAQAPADHSLTEDGLAIQFRIAPNLTLGTFSGGLISIKQHRAADRALRAGASFNFGHNNVEGGTDQTSLQVGLVGEVLHYPTLAGDPNGNVQMYFGYGPNVQYNLQKSAPEGVDAVTTHTISLGAVGTLGAEWFVRPRIGITAEYQAGAGIGLGSNGWSLQVGQQGVRFGASFYVQR